jgi:hypothetical protein
VSGIGRERYRKQFNERSAAVPAAFRSIAAPPLVFERFTSSPAIALSGKAVSGFEPRTFDVIFNRR